MNINQAYCKVTKQMQSLEWLRYNADQYWYQDELRKMNYEEEQAAIVEKAAKAEAWRVAHEAEKAAKLQAYLKKETPEEYKARKESQAQRTVKKETPEEYAARTEYMKKKEQLELEAETQRLFNKGEKKHQDHLNYLARQEQKAEREAERDARAYARAEAYEANQAYKNSAEGRAERERKDEKSRIWNSPEEKYKREQATEKFVETQREREHIFWEKHKNNFGTMACDSAHRTTASGGIDAKFYRGGLNNTLFKYPKK
jgi:predicted nucleic acid-binding protein